MGAGLTPPVPLPHCPIPTLALPAPQRGEWSEEQLLADTSSFHVRLTPMVEGSTWTSDQGTSGQDSASGEADQGSGDAGSGGLEGSGGDGDDAAAEAAHDATEL